MAKKIAMKPVKNTEHEEAEDVHPAKLKKEIELDLPEAAAHDKVEEADAFEEPREDDELAEEAELDTEEIDPFNDKWEE